MSENISLLVLGEYVTDMPDSGTVYPHSRLEMGQDYEVLGQIIDLSILKDTAMPPRPDIPNKPHVTTHPLPGDVGVYVFHEEGSEVTRVHDTGDEIVRARAEDLATIEVPEGDSPVNTRNRAVKAYLGALSGDTIVVVYHE
jgi:hypothetical protein